MNFDKYVDLAYALYDENHFSRCFHVTFIICKNRILSVGINSGKTHPINKRNPKFNDNGVEISDWRGSCSELSALIKLKRTSNIDFGKCSLINIRIDRNKKLALARPCLSCTSLINYTSPRRVFYTDNHGKFKQYEFIKQ